MGIYRGDGTPTAGDELYDQADLDNAVSWAEEWANKAEDSLVSTAAGGNGTTEYSALHHAAKAAASETAAAASEAAASTSESNAAASETNAAASEAAAAASETAAASSASAAATSETNAAASEAAAAASYDSFDDRYLGSKASDPALDNDGNALIEGALYWNSTTKVMRVYNGTAWETSYHTYPSLAGNALKFLQVNSGATAEEWFDLFGTANTWTNRQEVDSYFRVNNDTNAPSSGEGLELSYIPGTNEGYVTSYDRTGAAYGPLFLRGSSVILAPDGTAALTLTATLMDITTNIRSSSANLLLYKTTNTGSAVLAGGSTWAAASGAYISCYGTSHASAPGRISLVPGTSGEALVYNGNTSLALTTESTGVLVRGVRVGDWDGGSAYQGLTRNGGGTDSYMILANATDTFISTPSASGFISMRPGINSVGGSSLNIHLAKYEWGGENQVVYHGRVSSAGGSVRLPSGWLVTKVATGHYRVTHGLGHTNFTVIAVSRSNVAECNFLSATTTTFDVYTYTVGTGTQADKAWAFSLHMD